jgi:hypothetical protein
MPLEIMNAADPQGRIHARGICSHCGIASLLVFVGGPFPKNVGNGGVECNVLVQCQSCQGVIFLVGYKFAGASQYAYKQHYPVDNPEQQVENSIPASIRRDFVEGLRCRSVQAYRATVVMCRRALQASCQELKAGGGDLVTQINNLASKGVITVSLRDLAHQIRKLGNAGAHPDKDGLGDVDDKDAEDIVEFTEQYFQHVYVLPARMEALKKRRLPPQSAEPSKPPSTA